MEQSASRKAHEPGAASSSDSSVPFPSEGKLARAVIDSEGRGEGSYLVRKLAASREEEPRALKEVELWDEADWRSELAAWSRLEGSAASGQQEPDAQKGKGKEAGGKAAKGAKGKRQGNRGGGPSPGGRGSRSGKGPEGKR